MATKKKARPKKARKRSAAGKSTARKSAARKSARRPAARKGGARKAATRKSATAKRATRKSAKSATKSSLKPRKRVQRVRAVVEEKARQGLDAAREGLERIKQTTAHLVEEVKDRIGSREEIRIREAGPPVERALDADDRG